MKTKALGEICRPKQWKTVSVSQLCENGYPVYGANGVIGKYKDFNHKKETILVTCRGATCGTLNICAPFSYVNGNAMALDSLDKSVDLRYLYYFLKGRGFHDVISGSAQPQIIRSAIERIEVPICNIGTQKEITKRFTKIEDIIKNKKRLLADLDNLIKARFVEMFGSTNNEQVKIAELVEQKISTAKKDFEGDAEIKYIDISSINNRRNTMTGFTKYKMSNAPSRARQHVQFGDIIISTVRPNLKNVAMVSMDSDNLVASSGFCVLRPKKCTSEFLMAIVCSDRFTDAMVNVVTGANYPAIKNSDVLNYCVPLPSEEQQRQFANFVTQVDKSKFALSNELAMGNFYIRLIHDCIMHGCINL